MQKRVLNELEGIINFDLKLYYKLYKILINKFKKENYISIFRDLAEEYQVSWKEYWPFLNDFADFRTKEGLIKLEKYLEHKFQDQLFHYNQV